MDSNASRPVPGVPNEEYRIRREAVLEQIGGSAIAIIQGGPRGRSHDRFRQTNDFYYLTGVEVPHAYLLLDGRNGRSTLYLPYQSSERAEREGPIASASRPEDAVLASGVDAVEGPEMLAVALEKVTLIYTPMRQGEGPAMSWDTLQRSQQERTADPWDGLPDRARHFVSLLRSRCPAAELRDLAPTLDSLRLVKSRAEIGLLREAGRICAVGANEAMKSTRPGVMEYELDAILRYTYLVSGSRDVSYRAIIAGGQNAWYGHYEANNAVLNDGDLVLLDCAPDYRYYTSDIGRMFPVNGRYSDVQRQLYGFMVEYHKQFLSLLGPGEDDEAIRLEVAARMKAVVDSTPWVDPVYESAGRRALEFPYHLSHPVGLAVHDVGHYRGRKLQPGIVLSVDPQLIIPEVRGYYRVEDTVVITENGIENFTAQAPLELDDVEAMMQQDGMLRSFPPERLGAWSS